MRQTIGIIGGLAFLTFGIWAIGWLFLGWHSGPYHLLVPVAIVLTLAQIIRRLAVNDPPEPPSYLHYHS